MLYSINWPGLGTATCFRFAPFSHVKGDTKYSMVTEEGLNCERIFLLHTTLITGTDGMVAPVMWL